jgi:Flp pilus assembly protein CpaB
MTTTLPAPTGTTNGIDGRGRLPTPRRDRRPGLAALALLLIVAGALASALVAYRSGDRVDVLVAGRDIQPGQQISAADFRVARIAADGANAIDAAAAPNFYGTHATARIPAGTLLNRMMFLAGGVLPTGGLIVGLTLTDAQQPAGGLHPGDVVRAYLVPRSTDGALVGQAGEVLLRAARVVEVQPGNTGDGSAKVSLLVAEDDAPKVVPAAAARQVALVRMPDQTRPPVDLKVG